LFPVGSTIQVIGYLDKRKLSAKVLGWSEWEYLLTSVPKFNGEVINLPKDAAAVCRGTMEGRMFGFKAVVLHQMTQPFEYLFLNYPVEMEDLSGSKGFRLGFDLPAMAILASEDMESPPPSTKGIKASIHNLSVNGCVITIPDDLKDNSFDAIFLTFELPNDEKVENLRALVRKDGALPDGGSFGVEFSDGDPKFAPVFDFLLLANKISSMNE